MLYLTIIKANNKIFVKTSFETYTSHENYYFNGNLAKSSFHEDWRIIEKVPSIVQLKIKQPNINHKYVIKEEFKDKFQKEYDYYEVTFINDNDYRELKTKFEFIGPLYNLISEKQEPKLENKEFTIKDILEFDNIIEENKFVHILSNGTKLKASNQLLDKIIFPSLILPSCICKLTSQESYEIIRNYIQININNEFAKITSDYDFCFTVKKICKKNNDIYQKLFNNKNNIKNNIKLIKNRTITIFEMTHDKINYNNYTVIKGFTGNNTIDLKKNIKNYCKKIIKEINKPIILCNKCNGTGIVNMDKIKLP